jgi:hypothetical protein
MNVGRDKDSKATSAVRMKLAGRIRSIERGNRIEVKSKNVKNWKWI